MRISKISHKKLSDKEETDLLSGNIIQSKKCGKIRLVTKEEHTKYPDPCPKFGYYRVWIL